MTLTKDDFRRAKVATTKVDAPEIGGDGHAYLRRLTLKGREDWEQWSLEAQENGAASAIREFGGWRGYLLARTLCDEGGKLIFDDPDEALEILGECDSGAMDRLYDEAVAFNRLGPDVVRELEGNSSGGQSDDAS